MPPSDPRRHLFAPTVETHLFHDVTVRAYRRTYAHAAENVCFCGGMIDEHRWLHRDDLLGALRAVGFRDIQTSYDQPDHPSGPALSIFARRWPSPAPALRPCDEARQVKP
jgi:hypothetical protein